MLYLYALAAELGEIADVKGVQGEPLVLLPFQGAVVVAGEVTAAPAIDAPALKAQDALVRQLHNRAAALLPMRFGTTADSDSLARLLDARLLDRLAAVRNREQMVVRVVDAAPLAPVAPVAPVPQSLSGTAYLLARAKAQQPSPEMRTIAAAAAAIVHEVRIEPANQHGVHGAVYHLIDRGRGGEYREAVDSAAAALRNVHVIISGPSPPYAFA